MWKNLPYKEPYFILLKESSIYITNFNSLWCLTYSRELLLHALHESNIGLQINEEEMLQKGMDMLQNPDKLMSVEILELEEEYLDVFLIKLYGFPLKLKLKCQIGSSKLYYDMVVLPLLETLHDLKSSQQELCKLLKKKDKEIEEYKCEGGEIALRHLKTERFDVESHLRRHKTFEDNFETLDVRLLEQRITPIAKISKVDQDTLPNIVKEEPSEITLRSQNGINDVSITPNMKQEATTSKIITVDKSGSSTPATTASEVKLEPKMEHVTSQEPMIFISNTIKREVKNETQSNGLSPKKKRKGLNF